jgi:colanic acid biosynthesis glycosyl transferase WcaI
LNKKKTITIFTGNYAPEDTAIGLYTSQFATFLSNKGYDVSVITGFPYYPKWKIAETYKDKNTYFTEIIDGITVFRYKQFVPKKVTFLGRIKLMLSLTWGSFQNTKKIKETDLVICLVPLTLSILPAYILAKKKNAKLWIHVQDFEFDLAFQSGLLNTNFFGNLIKMMVLNFETFLFNKATIISSISYNMMEKAIGKTKFKSIFYFPNWVSVNNINPTIAKQHNYINPDKFTLLYSGNVGEKQDWLFFENFCKEINADNDLEIVIVGDGAYMQKLKTKLAAFSFIKFYEHVPYNELNNLLCSVNVHFLFQKTDVQDTVMPSKILGMMASGKPSIITGNKNSEVAKIFKENNLNGFFSGNNTKQVVDYLLEIKRKKEIAFQIGEKAKHFVLENFSENTILENFESKVSEIINKDESKK